MEKNAGQTSKLFQLPNHQRVLGSPVKTASHVVDDNEAVMRSGVNPEVHKSVSKLIEASRPGSDHRVPTLG